ncbi:hypothetical protein D7X33_20220 [Butyricicoccus sp. 1XD8-22]|nr:hypothetical protein D7X33_20220 [Butyricicoccus sp. 1XD8-22]
MESSTDTLKINTRLLKQKYEDQDFKKDYDTLMSYYFEKIKNCSTGLDEEKDQWILERLDKAFNLQFLQGYMVFDELHSANKDLFGSPEGNSYDDIFEYLPPIVNDLFEGHQKEIAMVPDVNLFAIDVLTEKADMELNDILQSTFTEFLNYGICYAFIDKYSDVLKRTDWMKLQDFNGISFLVPQVFMVPSQVGLSQELLTYDLFGWSGAPGLKNKWVGRLQLNPYDMLTENQYVSLMLSDVLASFEKQLLTNIINGIIVNTLKAANNEKTIMLDVFNISSTNALIMELPVANEQ